MQTLEILIEENAFGAARPVEVAADIPVAVLTSMLVEEFRLPKTDLFGKKLFYKLRLTPDGRIIPEEMTLRSAGVQRGAKLALDSYLLENSLFGPVEQPYRSTAQPYGPAAQPYASVAQSYDGAPIDLNLHRSVTLSDESGMAAVAGGEFSGADGLRRGPKKKSRRAFLFIGVAVLGAGIAGTSYAAYKTWGETGIQALIAGGTAHPTSVAQKTVSVNPATPKSMVAPLPTTAISTFMFKQHTQIVRSLVWSEKNNLLMSGSDDQTIRIWKPDGTVQQIIRSGASVRAVAWSADGLHLAAGAGNLVLFYDAQNGNLLAQGRKHDQMVNAVAWAGHGQGQIVSGGQDLRAVVWDAQQYQPRFTFTRHSTAIQDVAWAADGDTIASSTLGGVIRVWSGNSGKELHGYYFDGAIAIRRVAFSPTGERLAAGGNDGVIRLWNTGMQCQQQATGEFGTQCVDKPVRLQSTKSAIRTLAWSPDGRFLLSGSDDNTISLWYPGQKQTPLFTIKQNLPARIVAWSPDGKQFASGSGSQVFLWKLA